MARFYITHVSGGSAGIFEVSGQILDSAADVNMGLSVSCNAINQDSPVSARQQIQENLLEAVNAQLVTSNIPLVFIASDIEWVC